MPPVPLGIGGLRMSGIATLRAIDRCKRGQDGVATNASTWDGFEMKESMWDKIKRLIFEATDYTKRGKPRTKKLI